MFHSLDMSAESRRPVPAPRTRPVSRPEYFTPPVPPRRLTVPIDTPKASVVLEMSLRELVRWCDKLDVSDHGLKTEEQYRHALLQHLIDRSHRRRPTHSPFVDCCLNSGPKLSDLRRKQEKFASLVDAVQTFVSDESILPWLDKLQLLSCCCWMTSLDFKNAKEMCGKKPMLLIAGSTSSGKSTLVNALLGECVLPTSYNAATAALCEIKYADRKHAVVHLEEGRLKTIHCDLSTSDGRQTFESYVSPAQRDEDEIFCRRIEIFWPTEFLKDFHLVDSPGVTEDEASNAATRHITEQCQRDVACGFIYVLDSTRAAQEAAQAGGLLAAIVKGTKQTPAPDAAIFIANKWDLLEQQQTEKQRQDYLRLLAEGLRSRWSGFLEHQLLTLNANLACTAQQLGETTSELRGLCRAITRALPYGMDNMILKSLNGPQTLMNEIESVLLNTLRELNLPWEDRKQKRGEDWDRLRSFQASLEKGDIGAIRIQLDLEIDSLIRKLAQYLQSRDSKARATRWKSSSMSTVQQRSFDERNIQDTIIHRFCEAITAYQGYEEFCQWCKDSLMPDVEKSLEAFNMLKANIAGTDTAPITSQRRSIGSDVTAREVAAAVALAVPILFIGVPLALAVSVVAGPIYGVFKMIGSIKDLGFKRSVERGYNELVARACSDNYAVLKQIVMGLLKTTCPAVSLVYDTVPEKVRLLEHEMCARTRQQENDIPHYKMVLKRCQALKGEISKFTLEMNIHNYTIDDVNCPDLSSPGARGSFADVYKVDARGKGLAALKVMKHAITKENAEAYCRELRSCRQFQHKNLVRFYGSVVMSTKPLQLGLLFEWCGGGTLSDEIFGAHGVPGNRQHGYRRSQQIALDMLNGLKFLHSQGIVHRDLKPENIMITEKREVKVGDMGLAKPVTQVTGTCCGTILYMAPEVLLERPSALSADMFSIGMMLWEIWHGKRVYSEDTVEGLTLEAFIKDVTAGTLRPGGGEFLPGIVTKRASIVGHSVDMVAAGCVWASVARRCWSSLPKDRFTAREAYKILSNVK